MDELSDDYKYGVNEPKTKQEICQMKLKDFNNFLKVNWLCYEMVLHLKYVRRQNALEVNNLFLNQNNLT